jgi:hypothetical protein
MKSKPSLKSLAKRGLLNFYIIILSLIFGCSSPVTPSYLKEDIQKAIQDICRSEYQMEIKTKLVGQTLWLYLPLEDIFTKLEKPEKYLERFSIMRNSDELKEDSLKVEYLIKAIPEQEKYQEYEYNKGVPEKINNVWKVLRRVLFSMEKSNKAEPHFFCLVVADIKNGFEIKELFYYLDLKKVSYEFISWTEYHHRTIQDTLMLPQIIGDKEGAHLDYKDITLGDFVLAQIQHRIKLKFQKPEVDKNADIDKEILKIVVYTLKTYEFKDFSQVELNNLVTNSKTVLNQAALWARPME